jgi:serine/threonine-protein kinase
MKDPMPFGKYLLLERIDVGGMAEVFVSRRRDGAICALKRLLPGVSDDRELVAMFLREARLMARLAHPGIVGVRDLGRIGSSWFLEMEYVAGPDLAALLARLRARGRRMPTALSAWIAGRVAEALHHAHGARDAAGWPLGVVHRDVSPQNVLLSFGGEVKLTDFGIAWAPGQGRRDEGGVLRGKVGYMSPEQAEGRELDRRADLFALGAVLHEMLSGERLFRGDSDLAVLQRIRAGEVPPPSRANPDVPPALDQVVLRALARRREDRFDSAHGLAEALAPFSPGDGAAALAALLAAEMPAERDRERRREGPA